MKQNTIERFEILSTFNLDSPACAVFSQADGKPHYNQVVVWAIVKEHRYRQDYREIIYPEENVLIDPPRVEGLVRETVEEITDSAGLTRPVWVLSLACDAPNFEGYVDGVEGQI